MVQKKKNIYFVNFQLISDTQTKLAIPPVGQSRASSLLFSHTEQ